LEAWILLRIIIITLICRIIIPRTIIHQQVALSIFGESLNLTTETKTIVGLAKPPLTLILKVINNSNNKDISKIALLEIKARPLQFLGRAQ